MASLFVVDTSGDQQLFSGDGLQHSAAVYNEISKGRELAVDQESSEEEDEQDDEMELFGVKLRCKDVSKVLATAQETNKQLPSKVALQLDEVAEMVNEAAQNAATHKLQMRQRITEIDSETSEDIQVRKINLEKDMQNTKQLTGIEAQKALPTVSRRKQPILNRAERAKTKGSGWFDLPATEVTDEMRNELKIIQMRSVLDPKHFYKKNDLKVLPKYFQIGTVQHSPLDHFEEKHIRKTKKSLVDELLADEAFQSFNKRKYKEVIMRTDKYAHRKAMKKMKKLKKNK